MQLVFVETGLFTRRVLALGLEGSLAALQTELLANPAAGDLDPGTGGLRKVRMPDPGRGRGKRGGARVHFLYVERRSLIFLIHVYAKDDTRTLTASEKRALAMIVHRIRDSL